MRISGCLNALLPTLATIVVLAVLVGLGVWQLDRARQKMEIKQTFEARGALAPVIVGADPVIAADAHFRWAEARGSFQPDYQILLDNKVHRGRAGYHVLTPLQVEGFDWWLLINRGWVSWGPDRASLPKIDTPRGMVRVMGRLRRPPAEYFTLADQSADNGRFEKRWQVLDLDRYARLTGRPIYPVVLELDPGDDSGSGFVRERLEYEDAWIARHRGYALQWFSLAAALVMIYVVLQLRSRRRANED